MKKTIIIAALVLTLAVPAAAAGYSKEMLNELKGWPLVKVQDFMQFTAGLENDKSPFMAARNLKQLSAYVSHNNAYYTYQLAVHISPPPNWTEVCEWCRDQLKNDEVWMIALRKGMQFTFLVWDYSKMKGHTCHFSRKDFGYQD